LGRLEVRWEKWRAGAQKRQYKRVKIEEKLLLLRLTKWRAHMMSLELKHIMRLWGQWGPGRAPGQVGLHLLKLNTFFFQKCKLGANVVHFCIL